MRPSAKGNRGVRIGRASLASYSVLPTLVGLVLTPIAEAKTYLNAEGPLRFYASCVAEFDAYRDSTRSFTEAQGNGPVAPQNTAEGANGRLQFSDRNSRLGFGMETERAGAPRTRTYIEMDFAGYQAPRATEKDTYQSPTARLRLGYLQIDWPGVSLLAGEYWTLFGWQQEYVPSTVAVRPSAGSAYERMPQVKAEKAWGDPDTLRLQLAIAALRPVQASSGVPTVETGARVKLGGRLAPYTATATGDITPDGASLGVSTTTRQFVHPQGASSSRETHVLVNAVAVDLRLPLLAVSKGEAVDNTLVLVGEWTRGSGYGDQFTGWTGNIQNPENSLKSAESLLDQGLVGYDGRHDFTPIALESWQASLQYHAPAGWNSWATAGYGSLRSDNAARLIPIKQKIVYTGVQESFFNAVHNFTPNLRSGIEYAWNRTQYQTNAHGDNRRVEVSSWFRF